MTEQHQEHTRSADIVAHTRKQHQRTNVIVIVQECAYHHARAVWRNHRLFNQKRKKENISLGQRSICVEFHSVLSISVQLIMYIPVTSGSTSNHDRQEDKF